MYETYQYFRYNSIQSPAVYGYYKENGVFKFKVFKERESYEQVSDFWGLKQPVDIQTNTSSKVQTLNLLVFFSISILPQSNFALNINLKFMHSLNKYNNDYREAGPQKVTVQKHGTFEKLYKMRAIKLTMPPDNSGNYGIKYPIKLYKS